MKKFLKSLISVGAPIAGTLIGGPIGTAVGAGVGALAGHALDRSEKKEDAETQQGFALDQMAQQNTYNTALQHDAQAFNAQQQSIAQNFNHNEAQLTRDFDAQQAQAQRSWEEKMFDKENEYNSPQAQMQRLIDAGINPMTFTGENAIASAGQGASAAGGSPASISAVQSGVTNSGLVGMPSMGNPLSLAQTRLMNAQAENLEVSSDTARKRQGLDLEMLSTQLGLAKDELENMRPAQLKELNARVDSLNKSVEVMNSEILKNEANARLFDSQGKLVDKEVEAFEGRVQREIERHNKEMAYLGVQIRIGEQQIKESVARTALAYQQAATAKAQEGLYGAQTDLTRSQNQGQIIQNGIDGLTFDLVYKVHDKVVTLKLGELNNQISLLPLKRLNDKGKLRNAILIDSFKRDSHILLAIEAVASSLGFPFGAGVNYNTSNTTSSSTSRANVVTRVIK